ncbi:MAG: phenylalanine--tRNA ligase subunit beta [Patescibacteria group bacterium]
MDILIPDSWLREYLDTKAKPKEIQKYLSLCGPSVERINKGKTGPLYSIEVTTNRVDSASIYGIAREAATILPRFKVPASLINQSFEKITGENTAPLEVKILPKLVNRAIAVVLDIENTQTPSWMKNRLEDVGMRSLGPLVDITNYVMIEIGHPTHIFDYDRVKTNKIIFRESKKGERLTTLDGKTHVLPGNDIVIDDGTGKIIDLPGIMGTENSVVTPETKRVIFFVDNIHSATLRKTSMSLAIRTQSSAVNEKGIDPELGMTAILKGVQLYKKLCNAKVASKVHDIYPTPYKPKKIEVALEFICQRLGIQIPAKEIIEIMESLGFGVNESRVTSHKLLSVEIPSFRSNDISIPEDIVEEVARIYGYHNLPSLTLDGPLPPQQEISPFEFEYKAKLSLKGLGGVEVYTSSLVSQVEIRNSRLKSALKLKNPLGSNSVSLRTSLLPSLVSAVFENTREENPFFLFEMANIYLPRRGDLPEEKMTLAGVFSKNFDYRRAKGIVEAFLKEAKVYKELEQVGTFGYSENEHFLYFEFDTKKLQDSASMSSPYIPTPKYPPQVEDLTLIIQPRTLIGQIIEKIKSSNPHISSVELIDAYENTRTIRTYYQNPEKTLTNSEVEKIRGKILNTAKKFGAKVKD